ERSRPDFHADDAWSLDWRDFFRNLLALRRDAIVPYLNGARADGASAMSDRALQARWILGDGSKLTLAANFDAEPVELSSAPPGKPLFAHGSKDARGLAGKSFLAFLEVAS